MASSSATFVYLDCFNRALSRITEKFERDINNIGDITKELLNEMRENIIFKFLFGKRKKSKK